MHYTGFGILLSLLFLACSGTPEATTTSEITEETADSINQASEAATQFHNCTLRRKTLQENEWWIKERGVLVTIAADSTTFDKASKSDSHRIVEVYKTQDCSKIFQQTLPVNKSPDFAYYIAKGDFDTLNQLVLIRGFDRCYAYSVTQNRLIGPLKPKFSPDKLAGDAGSGSISDTRIMGDYLFGYAVDMGSFAFDLRDKNNPKAMMPLREFIAEETGDMRGIYLVEITKDRYQAVVPVFNFESVESGGLRLATLFDQPRAIIPGKVNATKDNRFVLLKEQQSPGAKPQPIGIDLEKAALFALPAKAVDMTEHDLLKVMKGE